MKVLVTGSRNWFDAETIRIELAKIPLYSTVIHGKCHVGGADIIAGDIARSLGHNVIECPVDFQWDGPWPMAGNRRNSRMLKENHLRDAPIDLCLAFPLPGSRGTHDMISKCLREKIPVWVWPTGMQED